MITTSFEVFPLVLPVLPDFPVDSDLLIDASSSSPFGTRRLGLGIVVEWQRQTGMESPILQNHVRFPFPYLYQPSQNYH